MVVSSASLAAAESDDDMPPALNRSAATPSPRRRRRCPTLHRTATHLSCVVETGPEENRVIVTGGFVEDQRLNMVYGATLTALPTMETDDAYIARAVRFGGFRGGGYRGETNEAWLLTIKCPKANTAGWRDTAS